MHLTSATAGKAVAGIAVALTLLAACGGDTDDPDTTEEATATDDTSGEAEPDDATTTTLSDEDQVLAAFSASLDALDAAYEPPDPEHPDLLATFDGEALVRHQTILENYQIDGLSDVLVSGDNDPQVRSVTGDTAVVRNCFKEVTQLVDSDTGEPMQPPEESSGVIDWTLQLIDGTWKVVQGQPQEESCEPGG